MTLFAFKGPDKDRLKALIADRDERGPVLPYSPRRRQVIHTLITGEPESGSDDGLYKGLVTAFTPSLKTWETFGSCRVQEANGRTLNLNKRYRGLNYGFTDSGFPHYVVDNRKGKLLDDDDGDRGIDNIYKSEGCYFEFDKNGQTFSVDMRACCNCEPDISSIDTNCTNPPSRVQYLDMTGEFETFRFLPNTGADDSSPLYGGSSAYQTAYYSNSLYGCYGLCGPEMQINGSIACAGNFQQGTMRFTITQIFKVSNQPPWPFTGWNYDSETGVMGPNILSVELLYATYEDIFPPYRKIKDCAWRMESILGGITFRFFS